MLQTGGVERQSVFRKKGLETQTVRKSTSLF